MRKPLMPEPDGNLRASVSRDPFEKWRRKVEKLNSSAFQIPRDPAWPGRDSKGKRGSLVSESGAIGKKSPMRGDFDTT